MQHEEHSVVSFHDFILSVPSLSSPFLPLSLITRSLPFFLFVLLFFLLLPRFSYRVCVLLLFAFSSHSFYFFFFASLTHSLLSDGSVVRTSFSL